MTAAAITAPALAIPQSGASAPAPSVAPSGGALLLQLRRGSNSVDVVVQGTGAAPVLRQRQTASGWQGQLQLNQSASLKVGPIEPRAAQVGPLQLGSLQPGIAQIGMDQIGVLQHAALTGPLIQGAHQRLIVRGPSGASPQEENQARE